MDIEGLGNYPTISNSFWDRIQESYSNQYEDWRLKNLSRKNTVEEIVSPRKETKRWRNRRPQRARTTWLNKVGRITLFISYSEWSLRHHNTLYLHKRRSGQLHAKYYMLVSFVVRCFMLRSLLFLFQNFEYFWSCFNFLFSSRLKRFLLWVSRILFIFFLSLAWKLKFHYYWCRLRGN